MAKNRREIFVKQRQLVSNIMNFLKTKNCADNIEDCGKDPRLIGELPDILDKFFHVKNISNQKKL